MPSAARAKAGATKKARKAGSNATTADTGEHHTTIARLGKAIGWLVLVAAWLFVVASLATWHPADPPGFTVYPQNDGQIDGVTQELANACGPAGAAVAHTLYKTLRYPAWMLVLGAGIAMALPMTKRRIGQPILRTVGIAIMTAALAGLNGLLLADTAPMADLAGGLLGTVVAIELRDGFAILGSTLWLLAALLVGAIVAFDRWLIAAPISAWNAIAPAGARLTSKAVAGTGTMARFTRAVLPTPKMPKVRRRLDDLEDDEELIEAGRGANRLERTKLEVASKPSESKPTKSKPSKSKQRKPKRKPVVEEIEEAEEIDEEPDDEVLEEAEGEDEYEDEDVEAEYEDEEEIDDEEDDDELPGAPQVFDRDSLKEKIGKLPVRFAQANRSIATQEDLDELQNVEALEGYQFPGLDLLVEPEENFNATLESLVREQAEALESALREYRIKGEVVGIESGPVITLYHVKLAPGTRVSALQTVSSDIARSLKAVNLRIVSNMVGRDTVGIEVPNPTKEKVRLKELMGNRERFAHMHLPMFLGKDASGDPLISDLTQMPHMLIAGTTGSGKSVCMNTIIMSFLYTKKPSELKLVLVDPKMVEMSQFKDIPHLMCPVVTEMAKAAAILEWAVKKMDERYELLAEAGCRDIASYNELSWEELRDAFDPQTELEEAQIPRKLPYMVFIIDELADLMMTNKEVEGSIIRIAQKARAVGIHLILATQRPQANVVTGLIKSNMPCRVSFKVASGMDSRIVLDQKGGEILLGQGDMLYLSPRTSKLIRAQGTLVDDKEIRRVARFLKEIAAPSFERQLVQLRSGDADEERIVASENNSSASLAAAQEDPMFDRAVEIVLETKRGSVSLLQRRLAIGYTRASRLIDLMGIAGIISEHKGSVARDVLITPGEWDAMKELANEMAAEQGIATGLFGGEGEAVDDAAGQDEASQDEAGPQDASTSDDPGADTRVEDAPWDDEDEADDEDEPDDEASADLDDDEVDEVEAIDEDDDEPEDEEDSEDETAADDEEEEEEEEEYEEDEEEEEEYEEEEDEEDEYEDEDDDYEDDAEDDELAEDEPPKAPTS